MNPSILHTDHPDRRYFHRGIGPTVSLPSHIPSISDVINRYKIPNSVPISSKDWLNIDELIDKMWQTLSLVRVYTKPRGLAPDYSAPVVLRRGKCSVEDFCNAIHKEIAKQMK